MSDSDLQERLSEPFAPNEIKWLPKVIRGDRAMAIGYVDARAIMDRLDAVFGWERWESHFQVLPNNSTICRLRVKVGDGWVEKSDVGSPSEQPDEHDRMKASFSDALKRAAIHFGIGRYLYRLPPQWVPYDAKTRYFKSTPRLPDWALPRDWNKAGKPEGPAEPDHADSPPVGTNGQQQKPSKSLKEQFDDAMVKIPAITDLDTLNRVSEAIKKKRFDPSQMRALKSAMDAKYAQLCPPEPAENNDPDEPHDPGPSGNIDDIPF